MASLNTLGLLVDHLRGLRPSFDFGQRGSCSTVSVARQNRGDAAAIRPYDPLPQVEMRSAPSGATFGVSKVWRTDPSADGSVSHGARSTAMYRSEDFDETAALPPGSQGVRGLYESDGWRRSRRGSHASGASSHGGAPPSPSARSVESQAVEERPHEEQPALNRRKGPELVRSVIAKWQRRGSTDGDGSPTNNKQVEFRRRKQVTRRIQGEDRVGSEFDIPEDSYGAAILAIVNEMQEIYRSIEVDNGVPHLCIMRCAFALLLLLFNLLMQVFLLIHMRQQVVMPKVHAVQARYREFHEKAYDVDGTFRVEFWDQYEGRQELCQIAMTNIPFWVTILFVWTTAILYEFRSTESLFRDVSGMPITDKGGLMMLTEVHVNQKSIVALTQQTRVMLFALVCLPKLGISLALLWLGYEWLSATTCFEDLVMNTVSMEFVLRIDELFFSTFLPLAYRRKVADINFFLEEDEQQSAEKEERKEMMNYVISLVYLFMGVLFVLLYAFLLQPVLPHSVEDVRTHCHNYLRQLRPICSHGAQNCYPYGKMSATRSLRGFV